MLASEVRRAACTGWGSGSGDATVALLVADFLEVPEQRQSWEGVPQLMGSQRGSMVHAGCAGGERLEASSHGDDFPLLFSGPVWLMRDGHRRRGAGRGAGRGQTGAAGA